MGSPYKRGIITCTVGVVLVALFALLGWIGIPEIVKNVTKENAVLKNGSLAWEAWEAPPVPITMQFYIFNVKNINNVVTRGDIPDLEQKGPYTFRETRQKAIQDIYEGKIDYLDIKQYVFDQSMSGSNSLSDNIATINPIYFTLASLIAQTLGEGSLNQELLSTMMHNELRKIGEGPTMTRTVDQLLFGGWNISGYIQLYEKIKDLASNQNITLPDVPESILQKPFFGLFSRNNTDDGLYTIASGESNYRDMGRILTWNQEDHLNYWSTDSCNMINGTDGTIFPPLLDKSEPVYLFNTDLCRSIYAVFEREVEHLGIKGNRFTVPQIVFGNYTENPDNLCYCMTPEEPEKCFLAGILELRKCLGGVPLLMSAPHFYMGDDKYVNGVKGLKPNKEEHETHLDLEPLTSVPLMASKRIQINFDFQRYGVPQLNKNIKQIVFPLMWVNESAGVDQETADMIQNDLFTPLNIVDAVRWVLLGVSIIVALVGIGLLFKGSRKADKD